MKKIIAVLLVTLPVYLFIFCTESISGKQSKANNAQISNANKSVVLLELFTSQDCSICPPADRLLGKYSDVSNVIALLISC